MRLMNKMLVYSILKFVKLGHLCGYEVRQFAM